MASSSSASLADSRSRPPQPHLQPSPPPPATASTNDLDRHDGATSPEFNPDHVSVEVLVKHLLSAKQSLSSFGLVMRANDLATHARRMHEESVILSAQTGFLRQGIAEQMYILNQMRRSMQRVYAGGQRDFRRIVRHLDSADGKLNKTIQMLRETTVERVFRPSNEEPKNLMDFVNEQDVHDLRDALKESLRELQNAQTSFDGDLLRFDDDMHAIEKMLKSATSPSSSGSMPTHKPMPHLLAVLTAHSHDMAQHLTSLTRHFDMCVKAVRSTEGGAALARRRAADMTQDNGDPVSISGVITEHESDMPDFEPTMDPHERAEIVQVVVQDAAEVDEVVAEIQAVLQEMEAEFGSLKEQADALRARYVATVNGFQFLDEVGAKLQSYVAAEDEFVDRWENEKDIIHAKMAQMEEIREFYEGYASAYAGLLLELERRRSVEDKIQSTLRKAKETVDAILDADKREREQFTQEIGDYLPTDLWVGMNNPLPRWEFVAVVDGRAELEEEEQTTVGEEPRTPTLANVGLARGD